jgi:hypothetical protein
MIDIVQQLLENAEQHTRAHAFETERACQARLMIDVTRRVEQRRIACAEDQL